MPGTRRQRLQPAPGAVPWHPRCEACRWAVLLAPAALRSIIVAQAAAAREMALEAMPGWRAG
jgi:hypothetical protein